MDSILKGIRIFMSFFFSDIEYGKKQIFLSKRK